VCCLHHHAAEYHRCLTAFLAEGLREGLRVAYIGPGDVDAAHAALADVGDLDRLLADGAVRVMSVRDVYGPGGLADPEQVVATWAAATPGGPRRRVPRLAGERGRHRAGFARPSSRTR
jgi:hypothetical protein